MRFIRFGSALSVCVHECVYTMVTPKVMSSSLSCWTMLAEADVGDMAFRFKPSPD